MKDFIECLIEDFLDKLSVIVKILCAILAYCFITFILAVIVTEVLITPFWPTFLVIALLPVAAAVLALLWQIGESLHFWLWYRKRRTRSEENNL